MFLGLPTPAWISAALIAGAMALLAAAVALVLGGTGINIATLALLQVTGVLALAVFSGNSGIISFGHAGFMGIGAYVSGILTMAAGVQASALPALPAAIAGLEWPLLAALPVALAAGLLAGWISGVPLSRLSTGSAAIGTLAFLIIIHVVLIGARDFTRGSQTFYGVPRATGLGLALVAAMVFVVVARLYRDSAAGLRLRASRENEVAAAAVGVDVRQARHRGWMLSVALASVAGALYGHFLGAFSPRDFYFDLTFTLVAMLIVGGMLTVTGAVAGALLIAAVVQLLRQVETGIDLGFVSVPGVFGLPQLGLGLALLFTIWRRPLGLAGLAEIGPASGAAAGATALPARPAPSPGAGPAPDGLLEVRDVGMRFGGLKALDGITFAARPGEVLGLIGPNGAGKTTLINIICGQTTPSAGQVVLAGRTISGIGPHRVATAGLARTFQNIRLFERMTALENVAVAALARGLPLADARAAALDDLARLGLADRAGQLAGAFAYGDRRRLEIARALALRPRFLLLDEPAAGMNPAETDGLVAVLERLKADHALGLIVVEHDMRLIMRLSDRMVVLNKGQKIAEGTPAEVRADPAVVEAYIGTRRAAHGA